MRILFTCHSLKEFAGTEMVTLSLSNYFLERDWEVDVFTLDYGQPFRDILDARVKVYQLDDCDSIRKEYDIIWGHQFPTLDYLLFHKQIKGKRVYYEALSFYMPIEAFPVYYQELTLNGVVSESVKNHLFDTGFNTDGMFVMTNYATENYFKCQIEHKDSISKIAIVSNHVPDELEDFKKLAAEENITVDIYGMHHVYQFIDEEVLSKYDVVISIGKTIFYTVAMGIPSYCYDKGVSVGYINNENFDEISNSNFAFRDIFNQKSADEILSDILNNYSKACEQAIYLKGRARESFFFDDLIDKLMKNLMQKEEMNYDNLYKKYPTLHFTSRLYIEDISFWKKEAVNWFNYSNVLNKDIAEKQNFINDILKSKSWVITKPLRRLIERNKKSK